MVNKRRGFTQKQVDSVLVLQSYLCGKCGADLRITGFHRDHISGDENDNKSSNLQLLCPTCNLVKGDSSDEYKNDLQWSITKLKDVLNEDVKGPQLERINDAVDLVLKSSYKLNRMLCPAEKVQVDEEELRKQVESDVYLKAYTEGFKAGLQVVWEMKR